MSMKIAQPPTPQDDNGPSLIDSKLGRNVEPSINVPNSRARKDTNYQVCGIKWFEDQVLQNACTGQD